MPWIESSGPADLPAIFQVMSIDPDALEIVKDLNETLSFGNSALGRVREEAIATVVAVANRCRFGALTHGGFLRQYSGDPETTAKLLVNYNTAKLRPADRLLWVALRRIWPSWQDSAAFVARDEHLVRHVV